MGGAPLHRPAGPVEGEDFKCVDESTKISVDNKVGCKANCVADLVPIRDDTRFEA